MLASIEELAAQLQMTEIPAIWRRAWEARGGAYQAGVVPDYLQDAYLCEAAEVMRLPAEMADALRYTAGMARQHPALRVLAQVCRDALYGAPAYPQRDELVWPTPDALLGDYAGLFPYLALFANLPEVRRFYRERGIPADILAASLHDVEIATSNHHGGPGRWGTNVFWWLLYHFTCRIFRLGRLQYMPEPYRWEIVAFRQRRTGQVVALSEAGVRYRADGLVDGTNDLCDPQAWTASLVREDNHVTGHPIDPAGFARRKPVTLDLADWEEVLYKGVPVLGVHIPGGEKLDHARAGGSFRQAIAFFAEYLPDRPFRAFHCVSWLLDPTLQEILPPEANLVRFQREFYLYPQRSDDQWTLRSVFGEHFDPAKDWRATAPRDTGLQRAILDHMARGGHMRHGAMFLLKEDVARWGECVYQGQQHIP